MINNLSADGERTTNALGAGKAELYSEGEDGASSLCLSSDGLGRPYKKPEREGSSEPAGASGYPVTKPSRAVGNNPPAPDSHKLLKCRWCGNLFCPTCDMAIPDYRLAMTKDPPICGVCLETTEAHKIGDVAESVRKWTEWQLEKK